MVWLLHFCTILVAQATSIISSLDSFKVEREWKKTYARKWYAIWDLPQNNSGEGMGGYSLSKIGHVGTIIEAGWWEYPV